MPRSESHKTSLAVWDVPSPVVVNDRLNVKVGAACSAACCLSGEPVSILDERGAVVSSGHLGGAPWPDTTSLYWVDVEVPGPGRVGSHCWSVTFAPAGQAPHECATATFGFVAVAPPEHRISVSVVDQMTGVPMPLVEVRLGPYKASTDDRGLAEIDVAGAAYELTAWKVGYASASRNVQVTGSTTFHIELLSAPEPERPYWM